MNRLRLFLILLTLACCHINAQIAYDCFIFTPTGNGEVELTSMNDDYYYQETRPMIPEEIYDANGDAYTVTSIGEGAFGGHGEIEVISIPSTIKKIGDYAFSGCESLWCINIENELDVEEIGKGLFIDCISIESLYFTYGRDEIPERMFSGCSNIQYISLSNVKTIGEYAFYGSGATNVHINNCDIIGDRAFENCDNLKEVTFDGVIGQIGKYSFSSCDNLADITFWGNTGTIGEAAFENSYGLKRVSFIGSVASIDEYAFSIWGGGCKDVYINNINKWCATKFGNSLSSPFNGGAKLHYVEGRPFDGPERTVLEFYTPIEAVNDYAFFNCSNLKKLEFIEGLERIGKWAFYGCSSITSVSIPSSLSTVNDVAFEGVGTEANPCEMTAPPGYDFGVDTNGAFFKWKSGVFWMQHVDAFTAKADPLVKEGQCNLVVSFDNSTEDYNGFQFDVVLPEGVTINKSHYVLSDRFGDNDMSVTIKPLDNGNYRVLCFSMTNANITGTTGPIITLTLEADASAPSGVTSGQLKNVMVSKSDGSNVKLPNSNFALDISQYVLGDINNDNIVSIADITLLVNMVLGVTTSNLMFADMDGNGAISVNDITALVDKVLNAIYLNSHHLDF